MAPVFLVLAAALFALTSGSQKSPAPAIVVSVRYPATTPLEQMRSEIPALAAAGYNALTATLTWREGEPRRGVHNLLPLDQMVALASSAGLRVRIQVVTSVEPEWKKDGTNALAGNFFDYVRRRFERRPGVLAVRPEVSAPDNRPTISIGKGGLALRAARFAFWSEVASGRRSFDVAGTEDSLTADVLAFGNTIGVVTRNEALFAPLQPRSAQPAGLSISGNPGVRVRILESAQAILIVALNAAEEVRKVSITLPPDIPEAIWQNMEHGNSVHFVTGPSGPVLEHTFRPEDVLVLAIRKTLR